MPNAVVGVSFSKALALAEEQAADSRPYIRGPFERKAVEDETIRENGC